MAETSQDKAMGAMRAIRAQDANKAVQYFDPHFVQHCPCIADGVEGLRHFIVESTPDELNLTVVRAIEDSPYVVTQLRSEFSGEDVFAIDRFQDGLIVEHWAFSSPGAPPNSSGHTQLDGPTEPQQVKDTEKNKAFARRYYETFHIAANHSRNDEFFIGDLMIRHEPGVHDGLGEFLHDVEVLMQHRTIDELKLLVGQGDLMFILAEGTYQGKPCAYIDLYRVENEKIVEHWGFPQMVPSPSESRNANGIF